jgi:hypothetical protein
MKAFLDKLRPIWTPHAGQKEFLLARSKLKVLACGRRWGKTEVCAVRTLHALVGKRPTRHFLIAPTLDQAKLLFDRIEALLTQWIERFGGDPPKFKRSPFPVLRWNGHLVSARSGHLGRTLRGNEATHLVIDEAAFVPEELVSEVAMPMLATTKGELTMISTPRGKNHFWRFFEMGLRREHGLWSRTAPTHESPHVNKGYLELQRHLVSDRAYRTEYLAEFMDTEGRVFRSEAIDGCLKTKLPAVQTDAISIGVDWGKYGDYTAVAVVAGDAENACLVELQRFNGLSWHEQVDRVAAIIERYPNAVALTDATGMGDPLVEMLQARLRQHYVEGFTFTNSSKAQLIDQLVRCFEERRLAMEAHPELIRELEHFEASTTGTGLTQLGAARGFHDDLVVALALAMRSLPGGAAVPIQLGDVRRFDFHEGKEVSDGETFSAEEAA